MSGGMGRRSKNCIETTKILWDRNYEEYICEKCRMVIHYNFGYKHCPYCGRRVIRTDERGVQTPSGVMQWR